MFQPTSNSVANITHGKMVVGTSKNKLAFGLYVDTIENVKQFFETNDVEVNYILETQLSDDISILNDNIFNENTNVKIDTMVEPSNVYINYWEKV